MKKANANAGVTAKLYSAQSRWIDPNEELVTLIPHEGKISVKEFRDKVFKEEPIIPLSYRVVDSKGDEVDVKWHLFDKSTYGSITKYGFSTNNSYISQRLRTVRHHYTEQEWKQMVYLCKAEGSFTKLEDQGDVKDLHGLTGGARDKHIKAVVVHRSKVEDHAEKRRLREYLHTIGYTVKGEAWGDYLRQCEEQRKNSKGRKKLGKVFRNGRLNYKKRLDEACENCIEQIRILNPGKKRRNGGWKNYGIRERKRKNQAPIVHHRPLKRDTKKEKSGGRLISVLDTMTGRVYRTELDKALVLTTMGDSFKIVAKSVWKDARAKGNAEYGYPKFPKIKEKTSIKAKSMPRGTAKAKLLHESNREARVYQRQASTRKKKGSVIPMSGSTFQAAA